MLDHTWRRRLGLQEPGSSVKKFASTVIRNKSARDTNYFRGSIDLNDKFFESLFFLSSYNPDRISWINKEKNQFFVRLSKHGTVYPCLVHVENLVYLKLFYSPIVFQILQNHVTFDQPPLLVPFTMLDEFDLFEKVESQKKMERLKWLTRKIYLVYIPKNIVFLRTQKLINLRLDIVYRHIRTISPLLDEE